MDGRHDHAVRRQACARGRRGYRQLDRHPFPHRERYIAGDIDAEYLARLRARFQHRPRVEVRRCDLENTAHFDDLAGTVDTVVCTNVLEHIQYDLNGLRNIYRALEPGGRAIILVPQGQEIYGTLDAALGHHRRYSRSELEQKLRETGFTIDRIIEFNRVSRPPWYVTGRILKSKRISRFELGIFDRLVWLWRRIDASLPWPSCSLIAIASKR